MFKQLLTTGTIAAMAAAAPQAYAQSSPNCAPREVLAGKLFDKYGEERTAGGLQSANRLVEIFSSAATGSFTILITLPSGQSCVVFAGENWLEFEPTEGPVGSKI